MMQASGNCWLPRGEEEKVLLVVVEGSCLYTSLALGADLEIDLSIEWVELHHGGSTDRPWQGLRQPEPM